MDVGAAFHYRAQLLDPRLGAWLTWRSMRRRGDTAVRVIEALVRPGDLVIDLGANWGLYTWALARLVGPAGRVIAVEPNPEQMGSLRRIRGRRSTVTIHNVAVSDHAGEAELLVPMIAGRRDPYLARLVGEAPAGQASSETVRVATCRLDTLVDGAAAAQPGFIKCDVEGHERSVLRGSARTLEPALPAQLVEIEQRFHESPIHETFGEFTSHGYVGYALHRDGLRSLEKFDLERDQLAHLDRPVVGNTAYVNEFLFVRPGTDVAGLIAPGD